MTELRPKRLLDPLSAIVCVVTVCFVFASCSPSNQLVIVNQSGVELHDVAVSGAGFAKTLGTIAPHKERRVAIYCRGESAFTLRFEAHNREISFGPNG